ncbi:type II secretion system protein [gamma proteobacterium HdN1]|nr:type II secretion system protein [gamma proteobacterium HdN1]
MSMFDSITLQSGLFSYLPALLGALTAAFLTYSLTVIIRNRRAATGLLGDESWRDPTPLIYRLFKPFIKLLAVEFSKLIKPAKRERISNRLSSGGLRYAILPEEFMAMKYICAVVAGGITVWSLLTMPDMKAEFKLLLYPLALVGFFYPDIWLSDQINRRRRITLKEFPFMLDLLVLGMRAGLNYAAALGHAIEAMPNGVIRDEFSKVLREIRAGKSRREALLTLADRMNLEAISNFVAAVNQVEETGGEIVSVLMVQAEQRRNERFTAAEIAANKAPIRMLIPMMLFLFPIIFMLLTFIIIVKLYAIGMLPEGMAELLK